MSEYHICKLSDGRDVQIDLEAIRVRLKTRRDLRWLARLSFTSDEYDAVIAGFCSLSEQEIGELLIADSQALEKAVGHAIQQMIGVNPN